MAENVDDKYKALAHPLRRAMLNEMKEGGKGLAHLSRRTGASPSRASNHLSLMHSAGLIRIRRRGGRQVYSIRKEGLQQVLAFLVSLVD